MARVEQMNKRTEAISAMVESIIKGNSAEAEDTLHGYLQMISKEIILGEMDDEEDDDDDSEMKARSQKSDDSDDDSDDDDSDDNDSDDNDSDDDDDDSDEKVEEGLKQPTEGAMKRKVVAQTKRAGKCGIEKHGNSAPHLDDKVKGKAKYNRFPKGKKMKKHANVKDDYASKCDGRDKNLGTTD